MDLVELSSEIVRYQQQNKMLDAHRSMAIEAIAMRVDGESMPVEAMPTARRSREAGLIKPTSTPRYLFGCVIFAMSDQLIQLAQKRRRIGLLRKIRSHCEFAYLVLRVV